LGKREDERTRSKGKYGGRRKREDCKSSPRRPKNTSSKRGGGNPGDAMVHRVAKGMRGEKIKPDKRGSLQGFPINARANENGRDRPSWLSWAASRPSTAEDAGMRCRKWSSPLLRGKKGALRKTLAISFCGWKDQTGRGKALEQV